MKWLLFSVLILLGGFSNAQQHYPLHPSVGDTIDRNEKLDYSLFPTVANKNFEMAIILFEQDSFYLAVSTSEDSTKTKKLLTKEKLIEAQKSIEKVNQYYRYKANQPKDTNSYQTSLPERKAAPIRMESAMTEQIKKEARMNIRLREDERRRREFNQGIRGQQLYIGY